MTDPTAATLLALFAWIAPFQEEEVAPAPVELELNSDWQPGTRYKVRITKKRFDWDGDRPVRTSEATTEVDAQIVEKRDDGYLLRWTFGATEVASMGSPIDPQAKALAELTKGLVLDLVTDELGLPRKIQNRKDVLALLEKSLPLVEKTFRDRGMEPEFIDAALQEIRQLSTSGGFEANLMREPSVLYFPCGGLYVLGQPNEYETVLPNPLGGEGLPAVGSLLLEELHEDEGRAVLVWTQTVDSEKAAAIIQATGRALAERMGKPLPKDSELPRLEFTDRTRYEFDLSTGIPKTVEYARTVVTGNKRRIDGILFEVTWPKK